MEYYIHDGLQQHGPFTLEELPKHKAFSAEAMIWCENNPDWVPARKVDELKTFFKTPPPLQREVVGVKPEPPKLSPAEKAGTITGKQIAQKASYIRPFLTLLVIVVIVAAGYGIYNNYQASIASEERKIQVRGNIRSYVRAGNSSYQILPLGGIYGLSISITNNTEYPLDDVKVLIRYVKANGETWKEETLDFTLVPPARTMTLRAPDSNRGVSIDYKIMSIHSVVLGL